MKFFLAFQLVLPPSILKTSVNLMLCLHNWWNLCWNGYSLCILSEYNLGNYSSCSLMFAGFRFFFGKKWFNKLKKCPKRIDVLIFFYIFFSLVRISARLKLVCLIFFLTLERINNVLLIVRDFPTSSSLVFRLISNGSISYNHLDSFFKGDVLSINLFVPFILEP